MHEVILKHRMLLTMFIYRILCRLAPQGERTGQLRPEKRRFMFERKIMAQPISLAATAGSAFCEVRKDSRSLCIH